MNVTGFISFFLSCKALSHCHCTALDLLLNLAHKKTNSKFFKCYFSYLKFLILIESRFSFTLLLDFDEIRILNLRIYLNQKVDLCVKQSRF